MVMTTSEILLFEEQPSGTKTANVSVLAKRTGEYIGSIRWNIIYRQYCFYPSSDQRPHAIRALADISAQLQSMMNEWMEARPNKELLPRTEPAKKKATRTRNVFRPNGPEIKKKKPQTRKQKKNTQTSE